MVALGLGALALLLVAGIAAAVLLGGAGPTPAPSGIAVGSATPSGLTPTGSSVIPPTVSPTVTTTTTTTAPTLTPSPDLPLPPTEPPTPSPTRRPTPKPTPTPEPTPFNCDFSDNPTLEMTLPLTEGDGTWTIGERRAWCVHRVTFVNESAPGATGTLALVLYNPTIFYDLQDGRYQWLTAQLENDFSASNEYSPPVAYPGFYMENGVLNSTQLAFEIQCDANACDGYVVIEYQPSLAPPPDPPGI